MNTYPLHIETEPKKYFSAIIAIEFIFLLLIIKSFSLGFVFILFATGIFFLYLYPEFGLAIALTGQILLKILFDNVQVNIPVPVMVVYFLILASGVIFYVFQREYDRNFKLGKLGYLVLLIALLMVICLAYSKNREYGLQKIQFYFLSNLLLFFLLLLFRKDLRRIENILFFTYVLGLGLGVLSIIQISNIPSYLPTRPSESVNPIWLARSLGVSTIAGIYVFLKAKRALPKLIILLSLAIMVFPMMNTGSRAPFIGLVASALLFFLLQPKQPLSRKIVVSFFVVVAAVLYFFTASSAVVARISDPNSATIVSTFGRFVAWLQAIQDFAASPLTGIGTGSFEVTLLVITLNWPHNLFLELASEMGILGLALGITFVVFAIKIGKNNIRHFYQIHSQKLTQLSIVALTIFMFALWNAMFSGDISQNEIVWFGAGLIEVMNYTRKNGQHPS